MGLIIHLLQNSRSFRIVWLLNELDIPYKLKTYPRIDNKAPPDFKALHPLGKAPVLEDDASGTKVIESGSIVEYLYERAGVPVSRDARMWIHFAEGTMMVHALAITYARWALAPPEHGNRNGDGEGEGEGGGKSGDVFGPALQRCEEAMSVNVRNDLSYIEQELARTNRSRETGAGTGSGAGSGTGDGNGDSQSRPLYLVGGALSAADIMLAFSVEFTLKKKLGVGTHKDDAAKWPLTRRWLRDLEARPAYIKARNEAPHEL